MFGFIAFSVLCLVGLVMMIRDANEMLYYREIPGVIIGFKEVLDSEPPYSVNAYIPIVKFTVDMNEYSGEPQRAPLWGKPDKDRVKPRSRLAGLLFFLVGILGSNMAGT